MNDLQRWESLTGREREIVDALAAADMSPKTAARDLCLSVNTLNSHRRTIAWKCDLSGPGQFWAFVERRRLALVPPPEVS